MQKFVYLKSYGCKMNIYDSDRIYDILHSLEYDLTDDIFKADLIVLNTCHIREKASEKVFSDLGVIRKIKEELKLISRDLIVVVAGCVAQAEGAEIKYRAPYVDIVIGPQVYYRLPQFLEKIFIIKKLKNNILNLSFKNSIIDIDFPLGSKFNYLNFGYLSNTISALLPIQEGCDKFCHFCVVPYTRGLEISRSSRDVINEVVSLVDNGVKEITFLGQNVNAFFGNSIKVGQDDLSSLLRIVSKINGLERLRYTTSHPSDMNNDLIVVHAEVPEIMPYIHLPVQSGSDRILNSMNRGHTSFDYLCIIEKLRKFVPDIAISSDFIVGYPGETDLEFQETVNLIYNVQYSQSYSFKYSSRSGTPASMLFNQVDESIKQKRLQYLQNILLSQQKKFNSSFLDSIQPVLIEKFGKYLNQKVGLTPYMQATYFNDDLHNIGDIVSIYVNRYGLKSLSGVLA